MNRSFQQDLMTAEVANELPPHFSRHFGAFLGLIEGDGSVANRTLDFANSNPDLIVYYLNCFRRFFGNSKNLHYYLSLPEKEKFNKDKIRKSLEFWRKKVKSSYIRYHFNKKGRTVFGVMKIVCNNKFILRQIRKFLSLDFLKRMISDENFVKGYISGFFAAEGVIHIYKKNSKIPHSIQLPSIDKKILMLIESYVKKLGIECRIVVKDRSSNYYCVNITSYGNYQKFLSFGLANLYREKEIKLKAGLKSYKIIPKKQQKTSILILKMLSKKPLMRKELYKFMARSEQQINGYLYSKESCLLKRKFITKTETDGKIFWALTDRGKKFLESPTYRGMKLDPLSI